MKQIFFFCIWVSGIIACRKPKGSSLDNGTKLVAIECDSAGSWEFGYTGDLITKMSQDTNLGTSNIMYYDSNSEQVNVFPNVFPDNTVSSPTIYYLSRSKPWAIDQTLSAEVIEEANFFYLPGTGLLDSVTSSLITFDLSGSANFQLQNIYKFTYSHQNITQIDMNFVSGNVIHYIGSIAFTYGISDNIFQHSDSLLYIYAYPNTAFNGQYWVTGTFFAETFSASTFDSVSMTLPFQDNIGSKMTYTLNQDGKVTAETFDNLYFEMSIGKKFVYK